MSRFFIRITDCDTGPVPPSLCLCVCVCVSVCLCALRYNNRSLRESVWVWDLLVLFVTTDQKLHGLRLRAEPAGHHAVLGGAGQPAAAGHRQNVPERERLRRVGEVRPHLQHAHPLPHLPLHRHAHHRLCPALCHHRHTQVRDHLTTWPTDSEGEVFSLPCLSFGWCVSSPVSLLRSVDEQERPFALGMQFVLLRTLGEFLFVAILSIRVKPLEILCFVESALFLKIRC